MINTQSTIVLHSQTALPKEYTNLLKEGSSVLVHVLKQTSANTYIASFAGGRFSIKSQTLLKVGDHFMAKVSFVNGKLNLTRADKSNLVSQNTSNSIQSFNTLNTEAMQLLASLGLPADNVSKLLLQTLVSSGAKFNLNKINKARNIALNFPGQEEEASEAALILLEKGIEPTLQNVEQVLVGFSIEENEQNAVDVQDNKENILIQIQDELKDFFSSLVDKKGEPTDEQSVERENGFLTVFNHLVSREQKEQKSPYHWVVVPFEFSYCRAKKVQNGTGVFRVFFDFLKKTTQKTVINFKKDSEIMTFVVNWKAGNIDDLKFSVAPEISKEKSNYYLKKLAAIFPGVSVVFESATKLAGFANGDVLLSSVKKEA